MKCQKCGKYYNTGGGLVLGGGPTVRVAVCRVCPTNRVYMVCERCSDLNRVKSQPCPSCGAKNMWEITSMTEA